MEHAVQEIPVRRAPGSSWDWHILSSLRDPSLRILTALTLMFLPFHERDYPF